MPPESSKFLRDILDAAERIGAYTQGKSKEDYLARNDVRDAVQWNFAVIGEALSQLNKLDATTANKISESRRVIAFRNQLIHGYGVVNHEITWDIIEKKLPILQNEVKNLLGMS